MKKILLFVMLLLFCSCDDKKVKVEIETQQNRYLDCSDIEQSSILLSYNYDNIGSNDFDDNIEIPGNKPCLYDYVDAYMIIDTIFQIKGSYYVQSSVFSKSDDKELLIESWNPSNRWEILLNANCVSSNLFLIGDTLSCRVDTIISGTCSPVILRNLCYSECFLDFGN
ncbi:MAG: hypothetical protein FWF51_10285 [Chitinivibrionia bacterium]|nr:hypothetical protein [Chitinivibrionia bacterium]